MRIILVHGAWSRADCWDRVVTLLTGAGQDVEAVDLPGHGADPTPPEEVTLAHYADALCARLEIGEPAVLVGHSMGGMAISAATERMPERVRQLIYVAAFLPRDGDSLLSLKKLEPHTIGPAVRRGPVLGTTVLDPALAGDILFQDLPAQEQKAALALLGPQANAVQTDPIRLSAERFGRVPRDYILCRQDRTVTPDLQARMCAWSPCWRVEEIESGHFPQHSQPHLLADRILSLLG
ncbi:alpha/beta fold hydrolase [Aliiruegeria lutimaris]|uniref:Pimeloyl-ACP methyl ester carboxylesterase n=1 Tax=Aliiruegeria lutimaris TaxID=571298 RepID=A0A1G9EFW6_9RHOB|nr:alpha/beta fold hydrolase [Aliiruegeria lutimaris]SDK75050.1 Pimeloyl-ACP methyl ester carboxylesterase [Aliiruegeria lutimaris]